jgi:plasmid stability protein
MGELTIRNIDDATLQQISHLARAHERSIEQEVLSLIRQALGTQPKLTWFAEEAARIAAMTPEGVPQTNSVELLREDRAR